MNGAYTVDRRELFSTNILPGHPPRDASILIINRKTCGKREVEQVQVAEEDDWERRRLESSASRLMHKLLARKGGGTHERRAIRSPVAPCNGTHTALAGGLQSPWEVDLPPQIPFLAST